MTQEIITVAVSEVQKQSFIQTTLVDRFIRFAGVCEKSATTYKTALRQLQKYFVTNGIAQPARENLEIWRDSLIADRKSPSTIQLYLTATKIFFRWLAQENFYPNIADNLKTCVKINHDHKKDALTAKQAGTLIQSVKADTLKGKRDKAIIALMAATGLRCVEVNRADVSDVIDQFGQTYLLIQGKGHSSKDSRVLLPAQVVILIREYLEARKGVADQPLFTSTANRNCGSRLSTQSISKLVKAALREIGINTSRLTAHSLRHTAATTMILAGVELTQVQQVLRHVNINTTMIYNNAVSRMKNRAEQTAADAIFSSISA